MATTLKSLKDLKRKTVIQYTCETVDDRGSYGVREVLTDSTSLENAKEGEVDLNATTTGVLAPYNARREGVQYAPRLLGGKNGTRSMLLRGIGRS